METQEQAAAPGKAAPEQPDRIPLESPNVRSPLSDEPVLDILADKAVKDLRDKPAKDLSANDKAILEILAGLTPSEILLKNCFERTYPLIAGLDVTVRTLLMRQTEAVALDISKYQQQRELETGTDGVERVAWQPTLDQVRAYGTKRSLCEGIVKMGNFNIAEMGVPQRLAFFEDMDTHMLNGTYRIMQKFFTAVGLLFPSDNQKEMLQTLKKVWAPRP